MYITSTIHTIQAFFMYTDMNYNVQLYIAHSPCFISPCWLPFAFPLCSPFDPLLLTWNPPSCDRIRPPRSQVTCKLTSLDPPSPQPSPFQISRAPITPRLTKTTSGPIRHLLSGTVVKYISKISTVMNSWDINLKVRVLFSKIIHKRALSEMFKN